MIWLTWRQFRGQAAMAGAAIAVLAAALAATGPALARQYRTGGSHFLSNVSGTDSDLYLLGVLAVLALPVLAGMFWGAPLVTRELDAGTHRLIWTHTTRARWVLTKLGLIGLAAVAAAGLLSLAVTWWAGPIDAAIGAVRGLPGPGLLIFPRISREVFAARGVAPLGYAAFGFVLGVTAGVILRRTLPAMAIVVVLYAVTQIVVATAVRPHLIPPDRLVTAITAANLLNISFTGAVTVVISKPGAWVIAQQTINATGRAVRAPAGLQNCISHSVRASQECYARFAHLGYRQLITYQPAGRFWPLQWGELAVYLGLAAVLAGLCTWWVRHRLP